MPDALFFFIRCVCDLISVYRLRVTVCQCYDIFEIYPSGRFLIGVNGSSGHVEGGTTATCHIKNGGVWVWHLLCITVHICQSFAFYECIRMNVFYAAWNDDGRKVGAVGKGTRLNGRYAIGEV